MLTGYVCRLESFLKSYSCWSVCGSRNGRVFHDFEIYYIYYGASTKENCLSFVIKRQIVFMKYSSDVFDSMYGHDEGNASDYERDL